MAKGTKKAKQQVEEEEEEEEEEEYEVEEIKKHRRDKKTGELQYFVAWVGYPSDEPGNDTWIGEDSAEGAPELVNAYWKSLPASKRSERTVAPSTAPKTKPAPAKKAETPRSTSVSRKRGASKLDDSPPESGRASRRTSGAAAASTATATATAKEVVANGSAVKGNAAKRAKRGEDSPELGTPVKEKEKEKEKVKKAAPVKDKTVEKKASPKKVEQEESEDDEEDDIHGRKNIPHDLQNYADILDWEPLVKEIDTIQHDEGKGLRLYVVWEEDDSYSWIPSETARNRCPQKVIDFYEGHLKFKVTGQADDDEVDSD